MNLTDGVLRHVSGTGKAGYSGDGGLAARATFNGPKGIALGPAESLVVADTENHAIRMINLNAGTINSIAGNGPDSAGGDGDGGAAAKATLNRPHGVCVGPDGTVYVGDTLNHRVRRIHVP
jgi:sugar lactone lactonase YvrE